MIDVPSAHALIWQAQALRLQPFSTRRVTFASAVALDFVQFLRMAMETDFHGMVAPITVYTA